MDASPMPVNSGASERMVARHFSGKLSADPLASLHGAAIGPEQQPAAFKKDVFSAAPMGCETCPCAVLMVWQQHLDSQST